MIKVTMKKLFILAKDWAILIGVNRETVRKASKEPSS